MKTVAMIPARWESTRFPGKPLAPILGRPMIEHVYKRALAIPGCDEAWVATDSEAIMKAVTGFGGRAVMTAASCRSGSDRLAEAADRLGLDDGDIVINVQGDQPAFDPEGPALLIRALREDPGLPMATLALPLSDEGEIRSPNHVKVVFGATGLALYFSRAPIPYPRDDGGEFYFKHVGIYGYRAGFLRQFVRLPEGRLERLEKLEQLRALENGFAIKVIAASGLSPEVDVPGDVAAAEHALKLSEH